MARPPKSVKFLPTYLMNGAVSQDVIIGVVKGQEPYWIVRCPDGLFRASAGVNDDWFATAKTGGEIKQAVRDYVNTWR